MRFHKLISVILHPIVIPTIGVLLFLSLTSDIIVKERQYLLISIVFFSTYIIPLIFLLILKAIGMIQSLKVETIRERKIPLFLMLMVFYILGKFLYNIPTFKELGILFYSTNISLIIIYFLFFFKIKSSLHIMSMSSLFGFFLIYATTHNLNILPIAIIIILLTGLLASSRLHLKAHSLLEINLGFFLGVFGQFLGYYLL